MINTLKSSPNIININNLDFPPGTQYVTPDSDFLPITVGNSVFKAKLAPNLNTARKIQALNPNFLPNPSASSVNDLIYVTYDVVISNPFINGGTPTNLITGTFLVDQITYYQIIQPTQNIYGNIQMVTSPSNKFILTASELGVLMTYSATSPIDIAVVIVPPISSLINRLNTGFYIKNTTNQNLTVVCQDPMDPTPSNPNIKTYTNIPNGSTLSLLPYFNINTSIGCWITNISNITNLIGG